MYTTTQGIKFDIITTKDEIIYKDEKGESLTWNNTVYNINLVDDMIIELTDKELC